MDAPAATLPPDPVALIRQIEPNRIRQRLRELDAERQALLILLRAALAASRSEREEVGRG
jgi:hypothetical protein